MRGLTGFSLGHGGIGGQEAEDAQVEKANLGEREEAEENHSASCMNI